MRPRTLQIRAVDRRLGVVEGLVQPVDLLLGHYVGAAALLELLEAPVIGALELLEGAHELFEHRLRTLPGLVLEAANRFRHCLSLLLEN